MSNTKDNPQPVPDPVDITKAAPETKAWRDFMATMPASDQVNGYFIPLSDLTNITNYAVNGVRAYFALRDTGSGANGQVHLYVVPVDGNGNDVLVGQLGVSLIYDTTRPCPNLCGDPNELNSTLPQ